jgi:hypothetical protein
MGKTAAEKAKQEFPGSISLRMVVPGVPTSEEEKAHLEEDLTQMGCQGLLARPWSLKDEEIVRELLLPRSNQWENTLRRKPEDWDSDDWRKVYTFPKRGEGLASWVDKYAEGMFSKPPNPKDGYTPNLCKDIRARRVLEFLVPILYPKKLTRASITMANTILGAFSGARIVDWGIVI